MDGKPVNILSDKMKDEVIEVNTIGDASEPRNILGVIAQGAEIARKL